MSDIYGRITGWGFYVPEKVVTNFDLEKSLETSNEWIIQRSGIEERHIAAPDETTATLAVNASQAALDKAGLVGCDLDLIIVATSSPDYLTPPVSSQVQYSLCAENVPAFVLEAGCTGFIYALTTAYQFIATGAYKNILVIGVEIISRHVNWQDRSTAVLFGDAAGAVVIQATDEPCGLKGFVLGSDGSQAHQIIIPAGGTAEPVDEASLAGGRHFVHMNGREVFRFASRVIGKASRQAVAKAGLSLDDVDWIIPHQANLRIIEAAVKDMQVPIERFVINIEKYGNTSAASIPLALSEYLDAGRIQPDDTLLLVSFGAGLTWGAAVLQMAPYGKGATPSI
ncbi:MAG: beta-ketoacyl-ACP synthase III [Candidatus Promineifilaceae bacterium]